MIKNTEVKLMHEIIELISDYYGVDIKENTNKRIVSTPRNICVYLIREMTNLPVQLIAEQFNRGASNFFNTNLRLVDEMQVNKSLKRQVESLKMVIKTDAKHYNTIGNDKIRLDIYKMLNRFNAEKLKSIKQTIENTSTY
jgi:hypothetical protein